MIDNMVGLFSGIGGFELAAQRAGVRVVAGCDIDKHASKVLASKFPLSAHFYDVETLTAKDLIDAGFKPTTGIFTAGFPCQDLSVAGRRAGLEGARSRLFWQIERLLAETKAQGFIIENVPGLLTSNSGRDFGLVLTALAELGYHIAWRVLDAQNFGVPQRRRRVFIVGSLTDHAMPREILFESKGEPRDFKALRETRSRAATNAKTSTEAPSWAVKTTRSGARDAEGNLPPEVWTQEVVHPTLNLNDQGEARAVALVFYVSPQDGVRVQGDTVHTLTAFLGTGGLNTPMVAHPIQGTLIGRTDAAGPCGPGYGDETAPMFTLTATDRHAVATASRAVRRLTPTECERLQGFPDGWTAGQTDGHRYKQLGNAVAVPVAEWIFRRIVQYTDERAGQ